MSLHCYSRNLNLLYKKFQWLIRFKIDLSQCKTYKPLFKPIAFRFLHVYEQNEGSTLKNLQRDLGDVRVFYGLLTTPCFNPRNIDRRSRRDSVNRRLRGIERERGREKSESNP